MKFVIFSKNNCSNCVQAKNAITNFGQQYGSKLDSFYSDVIYVDQGSGMEKLEVMLEATNMPKPRSAPVIFFKNKDHDKYEYIEFKNLMSKLSELAKAL